MPKSQRDVRNRIGAVKNIQKIARALELVAAARLRRAEQRIEALRPVRQRDPPDDAASGRGGGPRPEPADPRGARERVEGRSAADRRRPWPGRRVQLEHRPRRRGGGARARGRGAHAGVLRLRAPPGDVADVPRARAGRELHRVHRPPVVRRRAPDRRPADGRVRRRRGRSGRDLLQRLHLAGVPGGPAGDAAAAAAGDGARRGDQTRSTSPSPSDEQSGAPRARRVRARSGGDPEAARARLRGDLHLPRAARVDRIRARRADDGDAQRLGQRERPDPRT